MARKKLSEAERQQIRNTLQKTRERRKAQNIKIIELKIDCHKISKEKLNKLKNFFIQAKWIVNDMIAWSQKEENNIFDYEYLKHKEVERIDRDGNIIKENITLPVLYHRALVKQIKQNIKILSTKKKKGNKVGKLKFKSEINTIPFITGACKIKNNTHIIMPGFVNLKVYGLKQLKKYDRYELSDGRLIKKSSGYYIHLTIFVPNVKLEKTYREVGLDFGIKDNIITSDREKFNCNVRESEQLKFLQRKLTRKQKGSKRYYKLLNQLRREYEHMTNKKKDATNKLISYLLKNYDVIYFQDEMISKWRKFNKGFSREIQGSYLGRVKEKLIELEKNGRSFKIDKKLPTTKFCLNCGIVKQDITLKDRIFECRCGYSEDRDIHSAKNVKLFGSTKRAECLEQASVETLTSA